MEQNQQMAGINSIVCRSEEEIKRYLNEQEQSGLTMKEYCEMYDIVEQTFYGGMLLMDTNLIENTIRPITLGRNNYLFAGSNDAAQNAAIVYSLFATCKLHNVNAYD